MSSIGKRKADVDVEVSEQQQEAEVEDGAADVPERVRPEKKKRFRRTKQSKRKYHPESHPALEYLSLWKHDRDSWKFQKVRQVYLLQHLYERDRVPKSFFPTLLEYLEGMTVNQKKVH
eukprot:EC725409.1.p1 GENE.EC725409.1~~EC725409.1.p1  ORF type:complete len:118 (+),score=17.80 EC725409.1:59-412(+)